MAGFQKHNWGGTGANAAGTANQQPSAFRNGKQYSIGVKFAQYNNKGNLVIKLSYFYCGYQDREIAKINATIKSKYGDGFSIVKGKQPSNPNMFPPIYIVVKPDEVDNFRQNLPSFVQDIKATGFYTDASINSLQGEIEYFLDETPSPKDVESNETEIIKNWKDLFNELQNPETKKKFLVFQTSYACMSTYADAMLSPRNILQISLKDPQATFVTDVRTWEKRYGRRVIPGSPWIIYTKSENYIPPIKLMEQDFVVKQNGGWNALVKKSGGPWYGEAWAAIKRVKKVNKLPTNYYDQKGYDVRYTTPINPNNDGFQTVAGLVNNLTGELNALAKQLVTAAAQENGEETPDFDKKKEGIETSGEILKFKDYILAKCKKAKVNIVDVGAPEEVCANAIYAYAYEVAGKFNDLGNKGRVCFASAVLYAMAYTFNIKSSKVSTAINTLEQMANNPEEAQQVYKHSWACFKELASFSVNEAAGDITFEQYMDIFKNINPKNGIKNRFDDLNNRMGNLYNE